jgi:hypothetical protein
MAFSRKETRLGLRSAMYEAPGKIVSLRLARRMRRSKENDIDIKDRVNRWHMHWIKLVSDKDFHPCILIPIACMDQMSRHHLNPLNSGSMSSSPISYSTVSVVGLNPPYCWNTRGLALQYWVHHELLYSVKWLSLWKHTYTTFMIYFIGPVHTAGVKKN